MYWVFTRNFYRVENGQLIVDPRARKHTLARVEDEDQAIDICREYNDTHKPGRLSRKAEYTKE